MSSSRLAFWHDVAGEMDGIQNHVGLIFYTPSITARLGAAHYYNCGLALPEVSYWTL
jgi:hypothetical protein